jgi:WD40 repeat protein
MGRFCMTSSLVARCVRILVGGLVLAAGICHAQDLHPEFVPQMAGLGVDSLGFSSDGRYLYWDGGHTCYVWDIDSAMLVRQSRLHIGRTLHFLPFKNRPGAISTTEGGEVAVYDALLNKKRSVQLEPIGAAALNSDESLVAVRTTKFLYLLDLNLKIVRKRAIDWKREKCEVAWAPDGKALATIAGGFIKIIKAADLAELSTSTNSAGSVRKAEFVSNTELLVQPRSAGSLVLIDRKGKLIRKLDIHGNAVQQWGLSPDRKQIVTGSFDNTAKVSDVATGKVRWTLSGKTLGSRSLAVATWSPDGKRVAVGDNLGRVFIYDGKTYRQQNALVGTARALESVVVTPDGNTLIAGFHDGGLQAWDLQLFRPLWGFTPDVAKSNELGVGPISLTKDGSRFSVVLAPMVRNYVSESKPSNSFVQVYSSRDGQLVWSHEFTRGIVAATFDAAGKGVYVGGSGGTDQASADLPLEHWDFEKGRLPIKGPASVGGFTTISAMALHASGAFLAIGVAFPLNEDSDSGLAMLWNLQRDAAAVRYDMTHDLDEMTVSLDWSSDGLLATGGIVRTAGIWEPTGKLLQKLDHGFTVASVAFAPSGNYLLTGGGSLAHLWDVHSGLKVRTMSGHTGNIFASAFAPDGKTMITAAQDGTIRFWDTSGAEKARILALGPEDWAVALPNGYYMASARAAQKIAFVLDGKPYRFDQFDFLLNRPDKVLGAVANLDPKLLTLYQQAALKRLANAGVREGEFLTSLLPSIEVSGTPKVVNGQASLTVSAHAAAGDKVREILVRSNGVLVDQVPVAGEEPHNLESIPLKPGANTIQVSAVSVKGYESLRRAFSVTVSAPSYAPELYVVAVGVSNYHDPALKLNYAHKDAEDIAEAFSSFSQYGKVHTLVLPEQQATRTGIEECAKFIGGARPGDTVVLFFAGHGILMQNGAYYFATVDSELSSIETRALPFSSIEKLIGSTPAMNRLVLLDTCHSGASDKTEQKPGADASMGEGQRTITGAPMLTTGEAFELSRQLFADFGSRVGATVLAASSGYGVSMEARATQNGFFTGAWLEVLRSPAACGLPVHGKLALSDVESFVQRRVLALSEGRQRIELRSVNLFSDPLIRLN